MSTSDLQLHQRLRVMAATGMRLSLTLSPDEARRLADIFEAHEGAVDALRGLQHASHDLQARAWRAADFHQRLIAAGLCLLVAAAVLQLAAAL